MLATGWFKPGHVAALLTLKANSFDTLTMKQREIMINNGIVFCDQWGNTLWAAPTLPQFKPSTFWREKGKVRKWKPKIAYSTQLLSHLHYVLAVYFKIGTLWMDTTLFTISSSTHHLCMVTRRQGKETCTVMNSREGTKGSYGWGSGLRFLLFFG